MQPLQDPAKLTLRLEREVIEAAKRYADERGTSVSRLVENFFRALTRGEPSARTEPSSGAQRDWRDDLPPITRSLVSRPKGRPVSEEDYFRHLEGKHR